MYHLIIGLVPTIYLTEVSMTKIQLSLETLWEELRNTKINDLSRKKRRKICDWGHSPAMLVACFNFVCRVFVFVAAILVLHERVQN